MAHGCVRRARWPTLASVEASLFQLIRYREPGPFLRWHCTTDPAGVPTLTTHWDDAAIAAFQEQHFGKTLLFTDHTNKSVAAIVAAYRGQGEGFPLCDVSSGFRWTDQKIRGTRAYCVLALMTASLWHRDPERLGSTAASTRSWKAWPTSSWSSICHR